VDVVFVLKDQTQHVGVLTMTVNAGRDAEGADLIEVELALFPEEAAIEAVRFLGPPLGPGPADAGNAQRDGVARVPCSTSTATYFFSKSLRSTIMPSLRRIASRNTFSSRFLDTQRTDPSAIAK